MKTVIGKVIRHSTFIDLTIGAKIIGGGDPFYLKFWIKLTALERNCPFSISTLVAAQP